MSDDDSPLTTVFRLQRQTIEQTEDVLEEMLSVSREVGEGLSTGVAAQRDVQERALELSRRSVHASLDAAESVAGDAETLADLRASVDETFDALADQHREAFETVDEEFETVGDSYDEFGEAAVENLGEQVAFLVEFNEGVEDQLVETVEEVTEQVETLQSELEEGTEETSERVTEQADELADRFEEQLEELSGQFEEQADRLRELQERVGDVTPDDGA